MPGAMGRCKDKPSCDSGLAGTERTCDSLKLLTRVQMTASWGHRPLSHMIVPGKRQLGFP